MAGGAKTATVPMYVYPISNEDCELTDIINKLARNITSQMETAIKRKVDLSLMNLRISRARNSQVPLISVEVMAGTIIDHKKRTAPEVHPGSRIIHLAKRRQKICFWKYYGSLLFLSAHLLAI